LTKSVRSEHTLTRQELAEAVYAAVSLPRKDAAEFVDQVIGEICDALVRDGSVKLKSFGVFTVRSRPERSGRNPKTGTEAIITPRRVVKFKPASGLKTKINGGNEDAAD